MKTNEGKPQKPVSMPVIVLAVICLGAAAYLMLQPSDPGVAVESANSVKTPVESETVQSEVAATDETGNKIEDEIENKTVKNVLISERDPFLPSSLFVARTRKESLPVKTEKPKIQPSEAPLASGSNKDNKVKESEPIEWKGVVGSKDNTVVLIRHNNKTHLLRLGDLVPGTQYMVAQIATDSVLLVSPGQQLRLSKGGKK